MKNITRLFNLILFVCAACFAQAQNNIQTSPASGSGVCDGSAYLLDSISYQSWTWLDGNQQTVQVGLTYVGGLCPGVNYLQYVDSSGTNTLTFYIDTLMNGGCSGFGAVVSSSPVSGAGQCDGTATANIYGGTEPYIYSWASGMTGQTTSGLCGGENYFYATDSNGCFYTTTFYVYGDSTNANCSDFSAYVISTSGTSSPNACDGGAQIQVTGGSGQYVVQWSNGMTGDYINGFCPGYYTASVYDSVNGCSASLTVYIASDTMNYELSSYVYPYSPSADGQCDGSAYVDVYGGTAPYTFLHSDGNASQYATGLCSGIYSVLVTDANGDSLLVNYIVAEPSNIFNGGTYNDTIVTDTLYNDLIEDCLIDYLSLDTAFISNIVYVGMDSLVVTWSVIDGTNGVIEFLQSYTISTGEGIYELILQIFCPQRSGSSYVYAIDQVYFNPGVASINESENTESLSAYPNPFGDLLTIELGKSGPSVISIHDISGKLVHTEFANSEKIALNLAHLAKGQYVLHVLNEKTNVTKLIVK
jgi:hypothetical protein